MKNKNWVWICAVIVVILAVLLIWKPFARSAVEDEAAPLPTVEASGLQSEEQAEQATTEKAEPIDDTKEEEGEEESASAMILEDEGDLIIVVPEGQASDGF